MHRVNSGIGRLMWLASAARYVTACSLHDESPLPRSASAYGIGTQCACGLDSCLPATVQERTPLSLWADDARSPRL